jgi:hypothetical protein
LFIGGAARLFKNFQGYGAVSSAALTRFAIVFANTFAGGAWLALVAIDEHWNLPVAR